MKNLNKTALQLQSDDMVSPEEINALLENMTSLHPKLIDLSLDRIELLLEKLGNPHKKLPKTIHIAGTNGKGSTLSFIRHGLEAHGFDCHVITSPHLVRFNERIRLAGTLITDAYLLDVLKRTLNANAGTAITVFELTMAASFLACSEIDADYLLLETGLGGAYDATNVLEQVLLSIITPISFDHQHFLGDTIQEIASEKAGIIKRNGCCLVAPQGYSDAYEAITRSATDKSANLILPNEDYRIIEADDGVEIQFKHEKIYLENLGLKGAHQYVNASVACLALMKILGDQFNQDHIVAAFSRTFWPGRLQSLTSGVLCDQLAPNQDLLLDGGHNQDASFMLQKELKFLKEKMGYESISLITGMMQRRDPAEFYPQLKDLCDRVVTVPISGEFAGYDPQELVVELKKAGFKNVEPCRYVGAAFSLVGLEPLDGKELILASGSLYLAGEVLKLNKTLPI